MQFRYDEDFIEAVVFSCATGRRKDIPSLQIARFHRERERLYAVLDPEDRNTAFFNLHLEWFREWGFESLLIGLLREFPLLPQRLALLAVRQARGKADDGAELYVNDTGQRSAILAVRPDSFARNASVQDYLRHEFMHLNDMLAPGFGYSPALDLPGLNSAQQRLARERYRLLWDISIDGRLAARGHCPMQTKEQHAAGFARGYSFWPQEKQASVFASLWQGANPKHMDFLALIADPRGLRDSQGPAPGASCPLCEFPTFAWAAGESVEPRIRDRILLEFPHWLPEHGLCGRCLESYEALAVQTVAET